MAVSEQIRQVARKRLSSLSLGLENRLDDRVALLSGGQRQALSLIMATTGETKVLLLDEHTSALDPAAADFVMNLTDEIVRTLGITTIMVTHSMRQAVDFGGRLLMLHQGHVALDVSGSDRKSLSVDRLVKLFQRKEGVALSDDQLLLS
jgi:putative ABC transport system ATP-binding protein